MGKYKVKNMKTGGGDEKSPTITNKEREQWNHYVDWLRTKKVAGDPSLDKDGLGFKYLDEYRKENPNTSLSKELILPIQQDLQQYRQYRINEVKSGKAVFEKGVDENNFMDHLSKVDGYPGQYTTSVKYPFEYMRYIDKSAGTDTTVNKGLATINRQYGGKARYGLLNNEIDNIPISGGSAFQYNNSGLFPNPAAQNPDPFMIPQNQRLQNVPQFTPDGTEEEGDDEETGNGKKKFKYRLPLKEINLAATAVTTIANTLDSRRDFRDEQRKYYEKLNEPIMSNNFTKNNLPVYMQNGGEVEAEMGEAYQDDEGMIDRISEQAPTHEQGGVLLNNVERVLENTSSFRKDKVSKSLQITPEMMKDMFDISIRKSVSHSEALDKATQHFNKQSDKYGRKLNKNLKVLSDNPDDVYANNSMKFNMQGLKNIPQADDIFNMLFEHQEQVKSTFAEKDLMKYGGRCKAKYGIDDENDPYRKSKTKQGTTSDTGENTAYNEEIGSLQYLNQLWKPFGIDGTNMPNKEFQDKTYDYLLKNNPDVLRQRWKIYGNTNLGKKLGIGKDFDFKNLTNEQLAELKPAYVDGMIGARALRPSFEAPLEFQKRQTPSINLPIPNGDPSLQIAPPAQPQQPAAPPNNFGVPNQQEPSKFNEPLRWYDMAGPLMSLASSGRIPAKYNPVNINEVRLKLQNPEPALRAGQAQYNQATFMLPNNAAGVSNLSDIFAAKYSQDNQILGQYENTNNQIKNQEILYNANARDRQSAVNAQSRQTFETQMLGSLEAERQQKLTAFDDLFTRVALNKKLNREGNLLMQMFPNYNQNGQFNGNQRYFFSGVNAGDQGSNGFQVMTDPNTGQRYRVAYGPDGKLISSSKIFTDNKAIGAKR